MSEKAFETWQARGQTLEQVEARIHDGVPKDKLHARAKGYVDTMIKLFPELDDRRFDTVLEIGSGVGYVLEAADRQWRPSRLIGLDIAEGMLDFARQRLERDDVPREHVELTPYDGITFPFADNSVELIYSVASLQHAPRPYCFQALAEAHRVLRAGGFACIHLLSYAHFETYMTPEKFRREIAMQTRELSGHWHHYYTASELSAVLRHGIGASDVTIREIANSLYVGIRAQ